MHRNRLAKSQKIVCIQALIRLTNSFFTKHRHGTDAADAFIQLDHPDTARGSGGVLSRR
jgi:hypothetical protein